MSLALALKYRPTTFTNLVAQESVTKTLSLALKSDRIAHAYLFSGLRGSGKTSSARIFARALQCEKAPIGDPCNECSNCLESLSGRHIDIIEMDAASSRKIDDIRSLIEQTRYAPARGRYKIFIIDEVHMLTKEAFNALLKTLEEPPSYIKFILATTDPLKLPATILSRTQHFRFKKIPQKLIIKHLEYILQNEGVSYDMASLEMIARSGNGSLRDTLTLADQAIAYCDRKLESSKITQMLGVIDPLILRNYFLAIKNGDQEQIDQILELFEEYETEMILDEMMLYLKDSVRSSAYLSLLVLERYLRILADSRMFLSLSYDGGFVMLLTALKMREAQKFESIESEISALEHSLMPFADSKTSRELTPQTTPQPTPVESQSISADGKVHSTQAQNPMSVANVSGHSLPELFARLLKKIYDRNMELGEVFEACIQPVSLQDKILTWRECAEDKQKALLRAHSSLIKIFASEIFGESIEISVVQEEKVTESTTPSHPSTKSSHSLDSVDMGVREAPSQESSIESRTPNIDSRPIVDATPQDTKPAASAQDAAQVFYEQNQNIINAMNKYIPIVSVKKNYVEME